MTAALHYITPHGTIVRCLSLFKCFEVLAPKVHNFCLKKAIWETALIVHPFFFLSKCAPHSPFTIPAPCKCFPLWEPCQMVNANPSNSNELHVQSILSNRLIQPKSCINHSIWDVATFLIKSSLSFSISSQGMKAISRSSCVNSGCLSALRSSSLKHLQDERAKSSSAFFS